MIQFLHMQGVPFYFLSNRGFRNTFDFKIRNVGLITFSVYNSPSEYSFN